MAQQLQQICPPVTTLEAAEADIPSSVLPIQGLRRNTEGVLTDDALRMVVDALKSRGVDPTDESMKKKLLGDLAKLLCKVNAQYQFLMAELLRRFEAGEAIEVKFLDTILHKGQFLSDILSVSRHIGGMRPFDESETFIEGWQTAGTESPAPGTLPGIEAFQASLAADRDALESRSFAELRKHMVTMTREKNKNAANHVALYGFLNIVAVGLLIYLAGAASRN